MQFYDTVILDGVRKTRDGYLVGSAKTARTGIQIYRGHEVDPDNTHGMRDKAEVRVYRAPEEVFSTDTLASMAHRPVTIDHPSEMVDARNWKKHSGGMTGGQVARDGDFVDVPLTLMDQAAIDAWEGGKRELSWGYTCDIQFTDGVTPAGEAYDARQVGIRANHLAVCTNARGGSELRLGDHHPEPSGGHRMALKTIIVDGLPVETTDAGEAAVNKLRGLLDTSARALETAQADHTKALAAKDADLAKKDAEIEELKGKVLEGAALDAVVAERAAVVAKAKALDANVVTDGKSNAEIKRAVLGDAAKDKSDAYVDAAFDLKAGETKDDSVRDALRHQDHANVNDAWGDGVFAAAGVSKKGA